MDKSKIISLCMERQFFTRKANEQEYIELYRDMQPGQNVYWNGFGKPPTLTFRASFDDLAFNRERQKERKLLKGRFTGGNLGWIVQEDLELFIALYQKPLTKLNIVQAQILEVLGQLGPLNIQQIKEETGFLVKTITPALHRLQEAFMVYEDQYDGEWDRAWCLFEEMFPNADKKKYTRIEALKIVLQRFAYRQVWFDVAMAKSFYKIPEKEIKLAVNELVNEGMLVGSESGFLLKTDAKLLENYVPKAMNFVYAIHRNDCLYKANEHVLKAWIAPLCENLEYDHQPLQYLLIDGEFHGASIGHFRNGPYDLNDVICDLPDAEARRDEIIEAIKKVNYGRVPKRFNGKEL